MADEDVESEKLETYEVYDDAESVTARAEFEGTNSARLAIAGAIRRGVLSTAVHADDLVRFGFGGGAQEWAETRTLARLAELRIDEIKQRDDRVRVWLTTAEALVEDFAYPLMVELGEAHQLIVDCAGVWDAANVRARAWERINRGEDSYLAFLTAGLCSPLERESVMAAVAIVNTSRRGMSFIRRPDIVTSEGAHRGDENVVDDSENRDAADHERSDSRRDDGAAWPGESWAQTSDFALHAAVRSGSAEGLLGRIHDLARWRVELGVHSQDPIARSLAESAFGTASDDAPSNEESPSTSGREPGAEDAERTTSLMVHGTRAWIGDWWCKSQGSENFHQWVKDKHRRDLYSGGKPYSWSGALSRRHRQVAASRFKVWADSEDGLRTVFAHSYGGEVVARAINRGAGVDEVALLSAPITPHHDRMLAHVNRVMDVRLQTDLVLIGAAVLDPRVRQSLPGQNVVRHVISRPFWSHSATHSVDLWKKEKIAPAIKL